MTEIIVPGSFDIFHIGHLRFLQRVAEYGKIYIALGSDDYQEQYKRRPIQPYREREYMLKKLGYTVLKRNKETLEGFFQVHDFDAIACGSDWLERGLDEFLRLCGLSEYYMRKHNIDLIVIPNEGYVSTSKIINRILQEGGVSDE